MRIETQRLLLRPIELGDLDEFVALHADPEVTCFIRPLDRAAAKERIQRDGREWLEHGLLAKPGLAHGAFLGRCGLKYWPQFNETEIAWVLRRRAPLRDDVLLGDPVVVYGRQRAA